MRIPTLPASVERIRAILADPDVSMPEVVNAFLQDPPLAAMALKIANSVHYGLRTPTTSIQTAIPVLGLRTLGVIVLRASVLSVYADTKDCEGFSVQVSPADSCAATAVDKAVWSLLLSRAMGVEAPYRPACAKPNAATSAMRTPSGSWRN